MTMPGRCFLIGLLFVVGACTPGARVIENTPDTHFGHRYEGQAPDGRATLVITPPDSSRQYYYFPAPVDTLHVRPAGTVDTTATAGVPVEVLVKGALPDACMELHDVRQARTGHIVTMDITMRKPAGAICASVLRPYRFYVMLDGLYGPGTYTLKVNRKVYPFVVRAAPPSGT